MTDAGSPAINLAELRINRGLSQAEAARKAKVSKSVWGRAEHGDRVSPANALKIAASLGLRVTDLWPLPHEEAAAA